MMADKYTRVSGNDLKSVRIINSLVDVSNELAEMNQTLKQIVRALQR